MNNAFRKGQKEYRNADRPRTTKTQRRWISNVDRLICRFSITSLTLLRFQRGLSNKANPGVTAARLSRVASVNPGSGRVEIRNRQNSQRGQSINGNVGTH